MSDEEFYAELMRMCVHQSAAFLGLDESDAHITFEARVLYGILLGWACERNFTFH